jgi:2,3-bisphosphoglycerate-independent phosphoglycerate mutase
MDGWGINPRKEGNAIALAHTPNIDKLAREWPHTAVKTSGEAVGLPDGQMGNSEVGHQNIGAGKRVLQDYTRVSEAIRDGSFFSNPALLKAIEHVKKNSSQLHICGLLGNGGVHAHESHLEALLRLAQMHDVERVYIHAFTDGRDSSPTGGIEFIKQLQARAGEIGGAHAAKVATVSGRYYAMDRDNRWDRTGMTYFAMTRAEGQRANSAVEAIQQSYDKKVTDEFIVPTVIMENGHPVATVQAGDALIHYNFRPDRARQLTKAFVLAELPPQAEGKFNRGPRLPDLQYVMMTEYEEGLDAEVAYRADEVDMPLARVISEAGLRQFHTAETEKYAHVTYFINGRRETPFRGEERFLVPSPKVPTYDLQPEMSAAGITDTAVEHIRSGQYDLVIMLTLTWLGIRALSKLPSRGLKRLMLVSGVLSKLLWPSEAVYLSLPIMVTLSSLSSMTQANRSPPIPPILFLSTWLYPLWRKFTCAATVYWRMFRQPFSRS